MHLYRKQAAAHGYNSLILCIAVKTSRSLHLVPSVKNKINLMSFIQTRQNEFVLFGCDQTNRKHTRCNLKHV